ncbi:hypothetical protein LSAT2_000764 [Lamellibrachia satsuma]|nr:hypothetical protein LSAT2_000764 [Lamellibrachia satsuma]
MSGVLRKQIQEKDLLKEKEDGLKNEVEVRLMQAFSRRILSLEESIEAERAAHLESKFNSEIVQLRIRDLEGALKMERTAKAEILANSEKVNFQIRELQQVYDDERRCSKKTKDQMEKLTMLGVSRLTVLGVSEWTVLGVSGLTVESFCKRTDLGSLPDPDLARDRYGE